MPNALALAAALLLTASLLGCQGIQRPDASQSAVAAPARHYTTFGEVPAAAPPNGAEALVDCSDPAAYDTAEPVLVRGTVEKVCAKRGCWLTLTPEHGGEPVFVKFTCPIDGRLIPADAVGKPVVVRGTLKKGQISEAMARHFKEDEGAPREEIEAIQGPQDLLTMRSPGAWVEGLEVANPEATAAP